jgi:hypothetical protein
MGQSLQMRAPTHYLFVDLGDPAETEYWIVVLDAPRWRIERAIAAVGRDAGDVRDHLRTAAPDPDGSEPGAALQA